VGQAVIINETVLPTNFEIFLPDQPKNSTGCEKIRPPPNIYSLRLTLLIFQRFTMQMQMVGENFSKPVVSSIFKGNPAGLVENKISTPFRSFFDKSDKNSAPDFLGPTEFLSAPFVFCGRNSGPLATLQSVCTFLLITKSLAKIQPTVDFVVNRLFRIEKNKFCTL
jgi:hypothetical protein